MVNSVVPYYDDGRVALHVGHVLTVLAGLEPGSVQTCITSPPYWNLRDYSTEPQVWGDPDCAHEWVDGTTPGMSGGTASAKVQIKGQDNFQIVPERKHATCRRSGCWRGELGSEPTPEQFVANMVAVFRAVRRVLHDTGTLWCNLGDSYNGSGKGPGNNGLGASTIGRAADTSQQEERQGFVNRLTRVSGLKPKDLVGIPWRVAFALQADGWYLRSAITWAKKSPMPESVRDRPTNATEMIFLFSKQASYFFDLEAVRGISDIRPAGVVETANLADKSVVLGGNLGLGAPPSAGARSPSAVDHRWLCIQDAVGYATAFLQGPELQREFGLPSFNAEIRQQLTDYAHRVLISGAPVIHRPPVTPLRLADAYVAAEEFLQQLHSLGVTLANNDALRIGLRPPLMTDSPSVRTNADATVRVDDAREIRQQQLSFHDTEYSTNGDTTSETGANMRNFWLLGPEPYPQAHFATFVSEIPRRAILAGTSARGQCPACGAPWRRCSEPTPEYAQRLAQRPYRDEFDVEAFRVYLRECREQAGLSKATVDTALGTNTAYAWWEGRNYMGEFTQQIPTWDLYVRLKAVLGMDDRYDEGLQRYRVRLEGAWQQLAADPSIEGNRKSGGGDPPRANITTGWAPTCACDAGDPVPQVCLDPFAGSGTTLAVARWHQRRAVGIELNPEYARLIEQRLAQGVLL